MTLIDIILDPAKGYPLWLVIFLALLAGVGLFWTKIKSWFESKQAFGQTISLKKIEREIEEIDQLKTRVSLLEKQNLRLVKANTAYATTMMLIIDQYEQDNPDNKTLIVQMKKLIQETLSIDEKPSSDKA